MYISLELECLFPIAVQIIGEEKRGCSVTDRHITASCEKGVGFF